MLDSISEQLNACQSSLNEYIDEKRSIFPRLYFLSDDDLLELLGQARAGAEGKEAIMQSHLKKLFPGISGVKLGPGDLSITALCSLGEVFALDRPVDIDCSVELWLKKLEQEICSSLQNMTLKCLVTKSFQDQDPFSLPTQILCLIQNIRFTELIEKAIMSKELHKIKDNIENEHSYYAAAEIEGETEKFKKQAVILQCVYYELFIKDLIEHNVVSTSDWHWQKQLRFYLINSKEVVIKMGLAEISYSYEYLGVNTGQFVRTETTDESFLILTQSLHLGFVGNPFGPAGTGKTESVKALGALIGRLVLVFNCDEAMDAICMGRLLGGVALCGAWGCFDELNRLSADALAAVAHQLAALLADAFVLNGKPVAVSPWCGVAVTMNPAGRGYGGRRALPPALQHALRPLALRPPPRATLAARLLAAARTHHALHHDRLAADLDAVFTLASTLLSNQRHYDWGLRALKSAVGSCSAALGARGPCDAAAQRAVLRKVLRLNNLSKLTLHDAERFENILSMVFAEIPEEESAADPIYSSLKSTIVELSLVDNKLQIQKCMELYEQLRQRMGVAIVGPPGSGKSTIRKLLKSAVQRGGRIVAEYVVSAKAMQRSWLLGRVQEARACCDGVLAAVALDVAAQPDDVWSWVVCDGDVDPEWVEALNSVLDDNRLLTLPSGWRVQFGPNVNFIFETHSLEYASPATISRMGIILLSNECHCGEEILKNWIQKKEYDNETAKMAVSVLSQITRKSIQWISTHKADVIIRHCEMSLVKKIIAQFEYNLEEANSKSNAEDIVWSSVQLSIMGLIKNNALDSFNEEVELPQAAAGWGQRGECGEWADALLLSPRARLRAQCLRAAVRAGRALLVLGPDASAKNLLAEYVLKETNTTVIVINCTPILEPSDIIAELKRKNAVTSSGGSNTSAATETAGEAPRTLLLRALHRTATDQWGSSQIHAFLLQLLQQRGFWAQEENGPQWCSVGRVGVVATAAAELASARLSAALCPVVMPEPNEDELIELSRYYLSESVGNIMTGQDLVNLSHTILSFYKEVKETFRSKPHYKWNPSHIRQWCANLKWYAPNDATEVLTALNTEAKALFGERLITEDEKAQYNSIIQNYLKVSNNGYYKPKLLSDGIYLEQTEHKDWYESTEKLINQCLIDDEHIFGDTGIEVCEELSVLCPIIAITLNGGAVSVVGGAGAGRRAAAALVCAALSATLVLADQRQHFFAMFKNALTCASEGTHTLLVIGEGVAAGDWLAYVEAFLTADSVHALPSKIIPTSLTQNTQSFITAKHKLGIMICLDGEGSPAPLWEAQPLLRHRLCWLAPWSRDTLRAAPARLARRLSKESAQPISKEDFATLPIEGFINIYESLDIESIHVPARYIYFIKTYYNIYNFKKQALVRRQETLSAGVEALKRARASAASLQEEAAVQESELAEEQAKANHALEQIGATVRANTDKKEEMHNLKKTIEMENEKLQIRKKEIEAELASVEPVIAAARAAVGDIRPEALSEVRSLRAPPDVVRDVLEGVLRLMGIADTSWHSMKSFLSKRGVKEDIRCLDASQISDEAVQSVERLLERRGASFEQAAARRASAACAPLAAWVRANLEHARALARVRPLRLQQRELHQNLERATASASALEGGLASVEERVAALQTALGGHARHAAALELRVAGTTRTLTAAAALLRALANESRSWDQHLQNISQEILELSQRSLLAAGYLIFLPDMTEPQAREYVSKWCTLIGYDDQSFSVINFLTTPEKLLKWEADGLPLDQSAIKNAVFIDQYVEHGCGLTPLVAESAGDTGGAGGALAWLRAALPAADVLPAHSEHLHTALQCSARLGRILVMTEVECIEEWWWGVVRGRGVRAVLEGRAPAAAPQHVRARLATLHFTARHHALVDQLVRYAMQNQNPEMDEKSKEIKIQKATLQKKQYELQENLLKDLSSNDDILNDANLLESLNKTQSTSDTIGAALEAAAAAEREARAACARYEASASRCARLVRAARRLAVRRPLLALPAADVRDVYVAAVARAAPAHAESINDEEIVKYFTRKIIERVLLSLHKKDKYIVVMYLLQSVYNDIVPQKLWQLFVGNFYIMEDKTILNDINNKFNWIKGDCLRKITLIKMQDEHLFSRLSLDKSDMWMEFQNSGDLHLISILNISSFEKILAVMALRPESSYRAIIAFVDEVIGGAATRADVLQAAARWSRAARPALLLAPHAADALAAHARERGLALTTVRIEEGRPAWEAALRAVAGAGAGWLAVLAGASPLTRDLITFVTSLSTLPESELGKDFRLWIVAEDREIPPMLANSCVNVVIEPPEGVKRNACGTLAAWARDSPAPSTPAPPAPPARLLARLALLHAIVQERRNYIPLGWSRYYAWSWGDAAAAGAAVRGARGDAGARALCGALYAARVDAARDRAVLRALLARCLRDAVPALDAVPPRSGFNDYISALESLPDIDPPQLLELPANCRIAWENNAADNIIAGLQELNSVDVVKKGDTSGSLQTILSLWKKHMSGSPLVRPSYHIDTTKLGGWWGAARAAEAGDAAAAARALHAALRARARASSPPLLLQVPDEWQLLWEGPETPSVYIEEFCTRARAAHDAVQSYAHPDDYMPKEVDLREFLRPQRALEALRARASSRLARPLHALALVAAWDCAHNDDDTAVIVRGLSLSGARWEGALGPARPADPPHAPAPPLLLRYVPAATAAGGAEGCAAGAGAELPLYASVSRETELVRVRAPLQPHYSAREAVLHAPALFVADITR